LKVWIEEGIQQSDGIHTPARVPPFSNGARIMPWNTGEDVGGYTYGAHVIKFSGLSDISDLRRRNHVVHELGHAFKWLLYNKTGIDVYTELGNWRTNHPNCPDRPTSQGLEWEDIMVLPAHRMYSPGSNPFQATITKNSQINSWDGHSIGGKDLQMVNFVLI
jgi:hypothetical protein